MARAAHTMQQRKLANGKARNLKAATSRVASAYGGLHERTGACPKLAKAYMEDK